MAVVLMLSISVIFGGKNAVLGVLFLFFNIMGMRSSFSINGYLKDSIMIILVSILSTVASFNMYTSLVLNFIVPFLLIMIFSDELNPRGYFIYGLFFTLLQSIFPLEMSMIPKRICAVIFGLVILFIFNMVMKKIREKDKYIPLLKNGFEITSNNILLLSKNQIEKIDFNGLDKVTNMLNNILYNNIATKMEMLNNKETSIFQMSLLLDEINEKVKEIIDRKIEIQNDDRKYLKKLSQLLVNIGKVFNEENKSNIIEQINTFVEEKEFSDNNIDYDFKYILNRLKNVLTKYEPNEKRDKIKIREALKLKSIKLKRSFTINSCYFRFAIKVSIILCIGFFICHLIPFSSAYWIPITAYSMMFPYYEDTKNKMSYNFFGVLLGAVLFLTIFRHIPQTFQIIFMILTYCTLFSMKNEILRSSIGCQLALVLSSTELSRIEFMGMRVLLVCTAIVMTWLIDKFILHTDKFDGVKNNINNILYKDQALIKELRKSLYFNQNSQYLEVLLLESYVLHTKLIEVSQKSQSIDDCSKVEMLVQKNKKFILQAEKLINIFNVSKLNTEMKNIIAETLNEMEKMLVNLQNINDGIVVNDNSMEYSEDYIKTNILSCKNTIKSMNEMITEEYDKMTKI